MSRLPNPGQDVGNWGDILNDYLSQSIASDGTLKPAAITNAGGADNATVVHSSTDETITGIKTFSASPIVPTPTTSTQAATKAYVDSVASSGAPDANTSTKGLIQLAGDLAGTAASPTVPGLAGKANTSHTHTKADVGLANVDNTSDTAKPISSATQTALNLKAPLASPTFTGTVTVPTPTNGTDATTKAYVDAAASAGASDATSSTKGIIQLAGDLAGTAASPTVPGLAGKANTSHTHTASQISDSTAVGRAVLAAVDAAAARTAIGAGTSNLALGTTSTTAKAGDYAPTKADVGLANVDNTSDAAKPISTATQTALNLKAPLASPTFTGTVTVPTPTNGTDATTKAYVDAQAGGATALPFFVFTSSAIGGIGDGTTDNTAAWNAAMALLETAGGTLFFPVGVYLINGTTNVVPGSSLLLGTGLNYGAPAGSAAEGLTPSRGAVIRAGASMTRLIQLGRNPTTSAQADTGASMRDLIVDGQNLAQSTVTTGGRRNYIVNSQIYWGINYAVKFEGQNSYLIGGVVAQDNRGSCVGVEANTDHKIFDAQIRQPGTTGSCVRINVGDVLVRGCHMWTGQNGIATTADSLIYVGGGSLIVGITGNILEGIAGPEIKIISGASSVNITSNQFFNNGNSTDNAHGVIRAFGNGSTEILKDVNVVGNTVRGRDSTHRFKSLIDYSGSFLSTERWLVTGNEMVNVATMISGTPPDKPTFGDNVLGNGTASLKTRDSGLTSFSGNGSNTSFTIATGLVSSPFGLNVTPTSAAAGTAGISYIEISGTSLIVHTNSAPTLGSNNVTYAWQATISGVAVEELITDTTAPTVPGTPTATGQTGAIALSWSASTDAVGVTGYHIYRSDAATTILGSSSVTTYTDSSAVVSTSYTYTVSAYDAAANESAKSASSNSASATAGSSNFVNDTFTGVNGTTLEAHVADTGGTWVKNTATTGTAIIDTNRVRSNGTNTVVYTLPATPASADYTVEGDLTVLSMITGAIAGILVRSSTSQVNYYGFRYSVPSANFAITKQVTGVGTALANYAFTPTLGTTYHIKLTVAGTTLTAYIDGTQVATTTDSSVTAAGLVGVTFGGAAGTTSTGLHIDNVIAHP